MLVASTLNAWGGKDSRVIRPADVFPDSLGLQPGEKRKRRRSKARAATRKIREFFASRRAAMDAAAKGGSCG